MKITIVTLVDARTDFIEMQYASIKRFVTDTDIEYIVFNNSFKDKERFTEIEAICDKLSIRSIPVIHTRDYDDRPSSIVADSMNYIWQHHLKDVRDLLVFVDSDMFFVRETNIESMMDGFTYAFVPCYRGSNFEVCYPWMGLMFLNMNALPHVEEMNWSKGILLGHKTDVGGMNHYYLEKYKEHITILYLEMWNLGDSVIGPDGTKTLSGSLDGNISFRMQLSTNNHAVDFQSNDAVFSDKRFFPHQSERNDPQLYVADMLVQFENFLTQKDILFPHPYYIDLFKIQDDQFAKCFVFHYKSGNNWLGQSQDYHIQKTAALHKLFQDLE